MVFLPSALRPSVLNGDRSLSHTVWRKWLLRQQTAISATRSPFQIGYKSAHDLAQLNPDRFSPGRVTQKKRVHKRRWNELPTAASSLLNSRRLYCSLHAMSSVGSAPAKPDVPLTEHRLPLDVKPSHYGITVRTDLEKLLFDGTAIVE